MAYTIHYSGCDGCETFRFGTLDGVFRYVRDRDLGPEYRRPWGLQGEFAQFMFEGFGWSDLMNGSPNVYTSRYKPELLAVEPKLRLKERKVERMLADCCLKAWDVKDGPQKVASIILRPVREGMPTPYECGMWIGDMQDRYNTLPSLASAKEWVTQRYLQILANRQV